MALQGNLRDFSVNEILQLLGTQKKTGCLMLEMNTERSQVHVLDGRIVSTRQEGMKLDDPLLRFLMKVHRLSEEQRRGILSIHKESNRDLEDLLVTGRYLESEEIKIFIERQILNDLMKVVRWEDGTYRFDPHVAWPAPLVRLSIEGALIESARRGDEQKRFGARFKNPYDLLGVRDFPDPDEPLSEEERDLFGLIDGLHTVAEVVESAPLLEYEAYEALDRMLEAQWIEVVGHRDPDTPPPPPRRATPAPARRRIARDLAAGVMVLALAFGLRWLSLGITQSRGDGAEVFATAQAEQIRTALELYHRHHGAYPESLRTLIDDDWLDPVAARVQGYRVVYAAVPGGGYRLDLER